MDGVLIIDKPAGMTSHDVVARVRKIIGQRRVGHTGTLDPFATGVLVILIGRATRLAQFLSGAEKEYAAIIRLGYATDTGDLTGAPTVKELPTKGTSFTKEKIEAALAALRGDLEQTPPMYSAKKVSGKKLYELARRGEEVARPPIRVTIGKFESVAPNDRLLQENEDGTNDLRVRVLCSAGTYVRVLAEDFGERLGLGAHLVELRRTRAGTFKIADAITLERLSELTKSDSLEQVLISPSDALSHLPMVQLNQEDVRSTRQGVDLRFDEAEASGWPNSQPVRLRASGGELIAVGAYDRGRKVIHPKVVVANQ
jgi:tRNA pseudouridine55 synthase